MAIPNINFHSIRSFGGSQHHAFEELCSQLAALEPRKNSDRFFRKGTGGDAGVECFIRHGDGSETGWQAKYFFELDTSQLDKSIAQALEKHPRLQRFIVCLPFDLPDARVKNQKSQFQRWTDWVAKWDATNKKSKRKLTLELWGKTALVERLGREGPLYTGRAAFWFNETLLSKEWFEQRFSIARASLGQRYTPETNVALPIRRAIMAFCRDPAVLDEVERWGELIEEARHDAVRDMHVLASIADFTEVIAALNGAAGRLTRLFSATSADASYVFPLDEMKSAASDCAVAAGEALRISWRMKAKIKEHQERQRFLSYSLNKLDDALETIFTALSDDRWRIINNRQTLVVGPAGVGKSHLFGDAVDHEVAQGRPAVLIVGGSLIEGEPWSQIIQGLGLSISVDTFLGAMDAAAQAVGTRAVIFVDAINERHGIAIWAHRLGAFLKTIEPFPRVAIALSCRSTYLPYILPDGGVPDLPQLKHIGFSGRAAEAARIYLDRRGIVRMAAPNLVPEFENPLFLKTCCDYLERESLHELPKGLRGVTEIFSFYTRAVARSVEHHLGLDHKLNIVGRALETLAKAFDEGDRGYLEYVKAFELLEPLFPSKGAYQQSLLAQLISEGVLAEEPVAGESGVVEQIVRFSFERFSDHRIARGLLDRGLDAKNPLSSFAAGALLHDYVDAEKAYEHAGVIEALAIQLPERCGIELPDAFANSHHGHLLRKAFVDSVLWREQKAFTSRTLELLQIASRMSGRDEALRVLIAIATEPDNAFNAYYLDKTLLKLSMPERDHTWSMYVARESEDEDNAIETLIVWINQNGFEVMDEIRAELAAITLGWFLTTSHRGIRDRATKSMVALLAERLALAGSLIDRFKSVDDLYLLDRVMAAAYGAAMQGRTVNGLATLAKAAHACVFDRDEPIAHVLIRDHARGIIELAFLRGVLPLGFDIDRVRPPYRSAWPIEDVAMTVVEEYKEDYPSGRYTDSIVSSTVNDGDFARYVMDGSISSFCDLPITWVGMSQEEIYNQFVAQLSKEKNTKALKALKAVIAACDRWRKEDGPLDLVSIERLIVDSGKLDDIPDRRGDAEKAVDEAEARLQEVLGEGGWDAYQRQARAFVRKGVHFPHRLYQWPPSFSTGRARRWVCKRAHDFGWTPERFAEFDRYSGRGHDRYDHRTERIGKKYQWLALHELLARLGDNCAFKAGYSDEGTSVFQGAWQVLRRDIDPSLLLAKTPPERRQADRTWWMPEQIGLKAISAHGRLAWLESDRDFVDTPNLISVTDPKTKREWLVLNEHVAWNQWGMRDGARSLDRRTWFDLTCIVVRAKDCSALLASLQNRIVNSYDQLLGVSRPSEGYLGEYPWHPIYKNFDGWIEPSDWNKFPVPVQPLVTEYLAERSGHDYSIEEGFRINIPAPLLMEGLELRLSNGRALTYANGVGKVLFFDPSTHQAGPNAALIEKQAFLDFLKKENLDAVWINSGRKEVFGGKAHGMGFGGSRSFTSLYWLSDDGFKYHRSEDREEPTKEQLDRFFDGEDPLVTASNGQSKGTPTKARPKALKTPKTTSQNKPVRQKSTKRKQ